MGLELLRFVFGQGCHLVIAMVFKYVIKTLYFNETTDLAIYFHTDILEDCMNISENI